MAADKSRGPRNQKQVVWDEEWEAPKIVVSCQLSVVSRGRRQPPVRRKRVLQLTTGN